MLSHNYRIKLENICDRIANHQEVSLEEMIWADKISKANMSAASIMRRARRKALNPEMKEGDLDDLLNQLDLGDPDPSNHKTSFNSPEEIYDFFKRDDDENDENRRRRD